MAHWWPFLTKRKSHSRTFMTIPKREAQKHLWTFMAHWWTFLTKRKSHSKQFMTIPSAERKNIYEHSWLIDDHFWPIEKVIHCNLWPFQSRSAKTFMDFYGSLMNIFDQKKKSFIAINDHSKREAQKHLWEFMAHSWSFLTKEKSFAFNSL